MKRRPQRPALKQPLADELLESLLAFVQTKFYAGQPVAFAKDRKRLLAWVVLWPAQWLDDKAVTIPADRYRHLLQTILLEALTRATGPIHYLPAWLRQTVQSHFAHHGDEIYGEAKSLRTAVEGALQTAVTRPAAAPDAVAELAQAKRLLTTAKAFKRAAKPPVKEQLTFL